MLEWTAIYWREISLVILSFLWIISGVENSKIKKALAEYRKKGISEEKTKIKERGVVNG